MRDKNDNPIDDDGVPTAAIEAPPTAAYDTRGDFKDGRAHAEILTRVLINAGLSLGAFDRHMVTHLARVTDWPMLATIASWIQRAGQEGQSCDE